MNKKHLIWIIPGLLIIGLTGGISIMVIGEHNLMYPYSLYNCVYINAEMNDFNHNILMVEKIEKECIEIIYPELQEALT